MESSKATSKPSSRRIARSKSTLREYIEAIVLAVLLTIVIRGLVVQAFRIPTGSMENTLQVGDFLFVNKLVYGSEIDIGVAGHRLLYYRFPAIRKPVRGDIIVFRYPDDPSSDFIKRCVALEGQTVEIRDKVLFVDGESRDEPYVIHGDDAILPREINARDNFGPVVVPRGHIFMMGDNRDNSHDSRFWGPLPLNLVKGKAMILYWSWDQGRSAPRLDRFLRLVK